VKDSLEVEEGRLPNRLLLLINHLYTNKMEKELATVFDEVLNAMITVHDGAIELVSKMTADDISGFGTGKHEVIDTKEMLLRQMEKDAAQAGGVTYELLDKKIKLVDNVGVCAAEIILIIPIPEQTLQLHTRITFIFHKQHSGWKAIHGHLSFPSPDQAEGESYPIDALKARNKELEKLVEQRTAELKRSLEQLKATQAQLIQAEKMASLGELTAGIAHEIQNPLNFVNNFSDVNKELIEDAEQELDKGNIDEVKSVLADVKENEQKINHHGKRADGIVKSMLQHSRGGSGDKQATAINQLVEEHLKLAYHGFRAKDMAFAADIMTAYDQSVGNVTVAPQEIGRVLLNLFNNAFYAVAEKKKQLNGTFEPVVSISTKKEGNHILIKVRDNGTGMPKNIADKVFQPFFTTKATGEGTGLGLSLSYDIITKGHGGEIKLETREGEYAEFIICLPKSI
jgi:C4-dicarboxylate-specific signal transduction histidine kinase